MRNIISGVLKQEHEIFINHGEAFSMTWRPMNIGCNQLLFVMTGRLNSKQSLQRDEDLQLERVFHSARNGYVVATETAKTVMRKLHGAEY